jgi:hypothetical protein
MATEKALYFKDSYLTMVLSCVVVMVSNATREQKGLNG